MNEIEHATMVLIHAKLCVMRTKKHYTLSLKQEELDLLVKEIPNLIMADGE